MTQGIFNVDLYEPMWSWWFKPVFGNRKNYRRYQETVRERERDLWFKALRLGILIK